MMLSVHALFFLFSFIVTCVNGKMGYWNNFSNNTSLHVQRGRSGRTIDHGRRLIEVRGTYFAIEKSPSPMFRDPVFDGAADPTVIWYVFFNVDTLSVCE